MAYSIAIDGPAGAGKSTITKRVAKELNFMYVDTGAMYRAMAVFFLRKGVDSKDEVAVSESCKEAEVEIVYEDGVQQAILNGENITSLLRKEEVGKMASETAIYPSVRAKILDIQRNLAKGTDVIMEGRDIGTCVLPFATVKIYLTASVEARAKRRYNELIEKGETPDIEVIKADIEARDYADMNREHSPLKQAEDAVLVDSSEMGIDEVADAIVNIFKKKI